MNRMLLCGLLGLSLSLPTAGCGTVMFSHRHGEHSGRVDPNIVILDGIGLLFFIVPGLVAFGIDFASGGIYLPEEVERGEGPFIFDAPSEKDEAAEKPVDGSAPAEVPVGPPEAPPDSQ